MVLERNEKIIAYQTYVAKGGNTSAPASYWSDYKWQLKSSIRSIEAFEQLTGINFKENEREKLEETIRKFPLCVTPYYASLIKQQNFHCDPIFKQAFPDPAELTISNCDMKDPLHEDKDSPAKGITHRYPDRVLFLISNSCAMYCRHCTRKRKVGDPEQMPSKQQIIQGIRYIENHREIRDVLLSGGDPLMLPDEYLELDSN